MMDVLIGPKPGLINGSPFHGVLIVAVRNFRRGWLKTVLYDRSKLFHPLRERALNPLCEFIRTMPVEPPVSAVNLLNGASEILLRYDLLIYVIGAFQEIESPPFSLRAFQRPIGCTNPVPYRLISTKRCAESCAF